MCNISKKCLIFLKDCTFFKKLHVFSLAWTRPCSSLQKSPFIQVVRLSCLCLCNSHRPLIICNFSVVCVCMCLRERERKNEKEREQIPHVDWVYLLMNICNAIVICYHYNGISFGVLGVCSDAWSFCNNIVREY
jgi:hypothetical protein